MKIRTLKYIFKEGFVNLYRNKLMSLASISIVTASLIVFGVFYMTAVNLENNAKILNEQPEMEVFCDPDLDDMGIVDIEKSIKAMPEILNYKVISKAEAFVKYKEMLKNDKDLMDGYNESIAQVSFIINLDENNKNIDKIADKIRRLEGVDTVSYSKKAIDFIKLIKQWLGVIVVVQTLLLLGISVFIISNTIRLTVFARRKDISIMKYIGATDGFIRMPFMVEGMMIGLIGSVVAFIITSYGYSILVSWFNNDLLGSSVQVIKMVSLKDIGINIILYFAAIGIIVGAFGSGMSIRKYLQV
jgi:cell division transport system permease protein